MDSLLDQCYGIAFGEIQEELRIHGYAKSRKMPDWRTNQEALVELAKQYVYAHNFIILHFLNKFRFFINFCTNKDLKVNN